MWLVWAALGVAAAGEAEAERYRLQTELEALARKNAWAGVERTFVALHALGLPLTLEDYLLGSQAARVEGDMLDALTRLQLGLQVEPPSREPGSPWQTADALRAQFEQRYGYVHVVIYEPGKRVPNVERPEMPFSQEEREAILFAQRRIAETRAFMGLLPVGEYTLGEQRFEVVAGRPMLELRVGAPPSSGTVVTSP